MDHLISDIDHALHVYRSLLHCPKRPYSETLKVAQAAAIKEMQSRPLTTRVTRAAKAAALRRAIEKAEQTPGLGKASAALEAARLSAMRAFGELNGWEADPSCRANGKFVARIYEPYNDATNDERFLSWIASESYSFHVPPDPLSSIHEPGRAYFTVITADPAPVKWLPEQDGRLKQRWLSERSSRYTMSDNNRASL